MTDLLSTIPVGRENKISTDQLLKICEFPDVRTLRAAIHELRVHGNVILSTTEDGGGYYLPANIEEVRMYCRSMSSRASETAKAAESARDWLNKYSGQFTLF